MIVPRYRTISGKQLPQLPILLKMVGYYHAPKDWQEYNSGKNRPHCGIFWCKSGSAQIRINEVSSEIKAGECICYYSFDAHYFRTCGSEFEYCWLTFDGTMAVEILRSFRFPAHPVFAGQPPEDLFREASMLLAEVDPANAYKGSELVYKLLLKMHEGNRGEKKRESRLVRRFRELVQEEFSDSKLNLTKMAAAVKCHRTTLTRVVKQQMGLLPLQYLRHIRLQEALKMLDDTDYTAAEISEMCGFATPEYFSRKFRQLTGKPPRRYRNHS